MTCSFPLGSLLVDTQPLVVNPSHTNSASPRGYLIDLALQSPVPSTLFTREPQLRAAPAHWFTITIPGTKDCRRSCICHCTLTSTIGLLSARGFVLRPLSTNASFDCLSFCTTTRRSLTLNGRAWAVNGSHYPVAVARQAGVSKSCPADATPTTPCHAMHHSAHV